MQAVISKEKADKLGSILRCSRNAAVVVHTRPDGDALGSGIAMRRYLSEIRGLEATLVIPDTLPQTLRFLTDGEPLVNAETDPAGAERAILGCDLLIVLDMNAFRRAGSLEKVLGECAAREKVLIDHHLNPQADQFTLVFSTPDVSSASELLYWVLRALEGSPEKMPSESLYAIMTGMTTDTNNFANSVYPSTLEMAGELLAAGVDRNAIVAHLYQEYSETRIRAFAALLGEHLTILPGGIAYIVATRQFQKEYPLREGETEGLVNIPLGIGAVNMSLYLKEEKDHFHVSIRAKKGWSANRMAMEYFNGGGHELAAGGNLYFPRDIASPGLIYDYLAATAARFVQKD